MNRFADANKKVYSKSNTIFNANINDKLKDNLELNLFVGMKLELNSFIEMK